MRYFVLCIAALLALVTNANASVITFNTDPFAGSTALTTPGRQIVANEAFIGFSIATDVFALDQAVFAVGNQVQFVNSLAVNLPATGVNIIVLQDTDNDGNTATPFNAGIAANLIANEITSDGAGFFIYFNSVLDVARLVYSTNLNDNTADLKVLARMTNLDDPAALPTFTDENFTIIPVPEPSGLLVMASAGVLLAGLARRRRQAA